MSTLVGVDVEQAIAIAAGRELRRLRLRAGLSQRAVAMHAGTFRPIVSRAERGVHAPSLETCERLARVCGGSLLHVLAAVDRALNPGHTVGTSQRGRVRARAANDNGRRA